MTNIIPFTHEQFGEIRTTTINGEPWFVAADVCRALEIKNNRDAIAKLDADEKGVASTDTLGGDQNMSIVNEPGLYANTASTRPSARSKPATSTDRIGHAHGALYHTTYATMPAGSFPPP